MSDPRTTGEHPAAGPFGLPPRTPHPAGLFQGVLIAVVAGAIAAVAGSILTTVRLEEQLQRMQQDQAALSRQIEDIRRDIYRPRWDSQQMVRTPNVVAHP